MVGRGCVEAIGGEQYLVTIAWQGMGPVSAHPRHTAVRTYDGGTNWWAMSVAA